MSFPLSCSFLTEDIRGNTQGSSVDENIQININFIGGATFLGTGKITKNEKIVVLEIQPIGLQTITNAQAIIGVSSVPIGYRPLNDVWACVVIRVLGNRSLGYVNVGNDGTIVIYKNTNAGIASLVGAFSISDTFQSDIISITWTI